MPQRRRDPAWAVPVGVLRAVRSARGILISSHTALDGDAVGSELALLIGLERLGIPACIVNQDPIPGIYRFLPRVDDAHHLPVRVPLPGFDTAIVLDCGDLSRIGRVCHLLPSDAKIVNIDHHTSNSRFGDAVWVEPNASATGELLYALIRRLGTISREQAVCLYTAVLTDTGGFLYHMGPHTFAVAQMLVEAGADPEEIALHTYFQRPLKSLRLCSRILRTLRFDPERRACWVQVRRAMYRATGTREEDTEGILNLLRTVREAELFFALKERADGIRVSLRSKGAFDVERLARAFGGGGHREAAGCFLRNTTMSRAARTILTWVDEHGRIPEH